MSRSRYLAIVSSLLLVGLSLLGIACSPEGGPGEDAGVETGADACTGSDCPGESDAGEESEDEEEDGCEGASCPGGGDTEGDTTDQSDGVSFDTRDAGRDGDVGQLPCSTEPVGEFDRITCDLRRCWEEPKCVDYHIYEFSRRSTNLEEGEFADYERCGDPVEIDASTARTECNEDVPGNALNFDPTDGKNCEIMDVTFELRFWCPPKPAEDETDSLLAEVRADTVKPKPEVLQQSEKKYHIKQWEMDVSPLHAWGRDGDRFLSENADLQASRTYRYGGGSTTGETRPAGAIQYYKLELLDRPDRTGIGGRLRFEHRELWGDFSDPDNPMSDSETLGEYWVGGYSVNLAMSDLRDSGN